MMDRPHFNYHAPARFGRLLAVAGICGALAGAPLLGGLAQAATTNSSGTGGSGLGSSSRSTGVTNVDVTVTASGSGMRFSTIEGANTGRKLNFHGTAPASDAGRMIELQTSPANKSSWTNVAKVKVGSGGRFSGSWTPSASGTFSARAELLPVTTADIPATSTSHTGKVSIEVFKLAGATLYGPGLYGNKTACGETLTKTTIGVASRTLKCGTKVAINYRDHVIVVPVIDRGPYDTTANWDLTMATGKKIGMTATGTVGTITPAP